MNDTPQSPAKPAPQPDLPAGKTAENPADPTQKVLGHVPADGMQREFGGRKGPEATRYNDWELNGKCVDF